MKQDSPSTPHVLQRATVLHDQGQVLDAEKLYQQVLAQDPQHFGGLYRFGILRLQQRRFNEANSAAHRASVRRWDVGRNG
jgi:cytochrome c-type biogenesis protein CcmH/NrfG